MNCDIIHPFGAACYVCWCLLLCLAPPEKKTSAFAPVSVFGILVGLSTFHKAYRCFIPSSGNFANFLYGNSVSINLTLLEITTSFKIWSSLSWSWLHW